MSFWRSLGGMEELKLISADPNGALLALQKAGITMLDLQKTDSLTWQFCLSRSDSKKVKSILRRRGDTFSVVRRCGVLWTLLGLRKRPVLILGMLGLLLLSFWVPSRVFFVQIEGNEMIPARLIAEQAGECGITFGSSRRQVRSEQVKNQLLSRLPQLQWAGVNTSGCVAVITVQERKPAEEKESCTGICSIVAARDGIISEMTVLRGNGLCKPGQAVKAGQVLISGYTDCGICIRATRADGEILALTKYELTAVFPEEWQVRTKVIGSEKKFSLIIGKNQINFSKDSGISGQSCAKIYEQKFMTLPGGFMLPVSIVCEEWIYYDTSAGTETAEQYLQSFACDYITGQTLAGKIVNAQERITSSDGLGRLDGVYICMENIGAVRMEENVPNYGKSD